MVEMYYAEAEAVLGLSRGRTVSIQLQWLPLSSGSIFKIVGADKSVGHRLDTSLGVLCNEVHGHHAWARKNSFIGVSPESVLYDSSLDMGVIAASLKETQGKPFLYCGEVDYNATFLPLEFPLEVGRVAKEAGKPVVVPAVSAPMVALSGAEVYPVERAVDLIRLAEGEVGKQEPIEWEPTEVVANKWDDFRYVQGQAQAKWAMEVACAGGHNLLLVGSPGQGKSMLAQRAYTICPPLTREESLEVSATWQGAGRLKNEEMVVHRPFVEASKQTTAVALLGGGDQSSGPRPGLVALASRGLLLADEFFEWPRTVAEALRGPLQDRQVTISRREWQATWPADFQLVATANPCPCGWYGSGLRECRCTQAQRRRYLAKISGPILDRLDIRVAVAPVGDAIVEEPDGEWSSEIGSRVASALSEQGKRFAGVGVTRNAELKHGMFEELCQESKEAIQLLVEKQREKGLTSRGVDRLRALSRTVADLEESDEVLATHVEKATQLTTWNPEEVVL